MKKIIKTLLLVSLFFTIGCSTPQKHKFCKIHVYRTQNINSRSSDDEFIFWYILMVNSNYYYSYSTNSPVSTTDLNSVSWISSTKSPVEGKILDDTEDKIDIENLPEEVQTTIEEVGDENVGVTEESVNSDGTIEETESPSSEPSESSSSEDGGDSGSSDGGSGE